MVIPAITAALIFITAWSFKVPFFIYNFFEKITLISLSPAGQKASILET